MIETLNKLMTLFPQSDRRQVAGIFLAILFGAALEALCVSLIFPVVSILANPETALAAPFVRVAYDLLGAPPMRDFIIVILGAMVALYVVKNAYLALLTLLQSRFAFAKQSFLSQRLFRLYLERPYVIHLRSNSGNLIRNLTHEADQVIWSVLLPSLILTAEGLVALALVLVLFAVDALAAAIVCTMFGVIGVAFYRLIRQRVAEWGERRQHHEGERIRRIQEGLGGFKEIRILGSVPYFLKSFAFHNRGRGRYYSRHILAQGLPLLLLEVLAMASLLAIVAASLLRNNPFELVLPMLGLFVGASFRLVPAVNRVIITFQQIRFCKATIDTLHAELGPWRETVSTHGTATPLRLEHDLRIEDLRFTYPGAKRTTIDGISLDISQGTTIGFTGKSGSGKTTLADLVLGLLAPDSGRILVDGRDIGTNLAGWQSQLGYIPQSIYLSDHTVRHNVAFGLQREEIDDTAVWRALAAAQLDDFVRELPGGLDAPVGEHGTRLSGGQRQRIGIARALYRDPPVLVLDEATAALDNATESNVMRAIHALHGQKTILIIAHRLTTLEACDCVVRMEGGRILACGSPAQMLAASKTAGIATRSTNQPLSK